MVDSSDRSATSRSGRRAGRLFILISVLLVVLPPAAALGWTQYRYGQGTYDYESLIIESTSGFLEREYNGAYRSGGCAGGVWEVQYRVSPGGYANITSRNETQCNPTEIGATVGPRRAWCEKHGSALAAPGPYNCDTTLP